MKKVLVVILMLFVVVSCSKSKSFKVGNTVYTTEQTIGATTKENFDEMIHQSNHKNAEAFKDMVLFGDLYIIEANTKCQVLENDLGKVKCKVNIAGIDRNLWINPKFLK